MKKVIFNSTCGFSIVMLVLLAFMSTACMKNDNHNQEPTKPIIDPPKSNLFDIYQVRKYSEGGNIELYAYQAILSTSALDAYTISDISVSNERNYNYKNQIVKLFYEKNDENSFNIYVDKGTKDQPNKQKIAVWNVSYYATPKEGSLSMPKAVTIEKEETDMLIPEGLENVNIKYSQDLPIELIGEKTLVNIEWYNNKRVKRIELKDSQKEEDNVSYEYIYTNDSSEFKGVHNPSPGVFWKIASTYGLKMNSLPVFVNKLVPFLPEPDLLPVKVIMKDNDGSHTYLYGYQWVNEQNFKMVVGENNTLGSSYIYDVIMVMKKK